MQKRLVALLVVLGASAGTARADDKAAAAKGAPPKVKVFYFSGDTIKGDLIRPDGLVVDIPGVAKNSSLIHIRRDFIAESVKSAEDL